MSIVLTVPTAIILDTAPLSLLARKPGHSQGDACKVWFSKLEPAGHRLYVPEIADYELRRELLRSGKHESLALLDQFNAAEPDRYLPLKTSEVREAASLWARARNQGLGGASPDALDGDVLIVAQAYGLLRSTDMFSAIVATTNVRHMMALFKSALWTDIHAEE